jgi:type 1 fimbria pilin
MRRSRSAVAVLAITAAVLCAAFAEAGAAAAAPKLPASGTITLVGNTVDSTKQIGANTVTKAVAVVDFGGTLVGLGLRLFAIARRHPYGR